MSFSIHFLCLLYIQKKGGEIMLYKFLTTCVTVTFLAISPMVAFAQTVTTSPTLGVRSANQAARLAKLHAFCDTQVDNRISSLNTVSARINALVKLSSTQKAQFTGEIRTNENNLTALKAKCDADTDVPTLRADYLSIFTSYRIYAEFLPQVHLLAAADSMGVTADKLTDLATKLQDRIQKVGNPSNLTSLLSDMQTKVADAEQQYSTVQSQVTSLTPQSFDTDKSGTQSILKNARSEIQTGAADLRAAFSDARQIIQGLKGLTTPTPTP